MTPNDNEKVILSGKRKFALIIEPDFTLANSIKALLITQEYLVLVAHSLKEIRYRVNSFKNSDMVPTLILLCPHCAGTNETSLSHYIRASFPNTKIIYTSKPDVDLGYGIQHLNLKDSPNHKSSDKSDVLKNMRTASRREEVQKVIRRKSFEMAEEARRAYGQSKALTVVSNSIDRTVFEGLLIDMFDTSLRSSRKQAWANIKWKAVKFGYKLDMNYIRAMWRRFKNEP